MHRLETIDLGTYRGSDYFLTGFVKPEPTPGAAFDPAVDAEQYGIVLARSSTSGTNVEIVRMDTAHGQNPHLDLIYLPPAAGLDRQVDLDEYYTYDRMKRYLLTHWTDFVDGYVYYHESDDTGNGE